MELLDLSARNKLLNIPRSKTAKLLEIIDERSTEVYRLLVKEGKALTFLPGRAGRKGELVDDEEMETGSDDVDVDERLLIFDDDVEPSAIRAEHQDTKLQTRLTPQGLQKRLLDLYHDSRTLEEEQGVNILYLTLGTLKWIDPNNKENIRYAPLILIPVSLERGNVGERFKLRARQDEIIENLSLESYLQRTHEILLPKINTDEELDLSRYIDEVSQAVQIKPDWGVKENDITLGFFSFAKFLMYRDLDPENWPEDDNITDQPLIQSLMVDGFNEKDERLSDDAPIDPFILPKDMLHIMDSDTSQTLAIHDVRQGKNLIIQGTPGTGKSQTIANIIASAVADGKTVLFVAEKMAALEVVKRRLDHAGVGDACLELHSNKANKKVFLEELKRVWELGSPRGEFPETLVENLTDARDRLNAHPARLHKIYHPSSFTPYQVMGHLVRLRQSGQAPTDFSLKNFENWNANDLEKRLDLVKEIVERIRDIGVPDRHPWSGVGLEQILPMDVEKLLPRLQQLEDDVDRLTTDIDCLSGKLEVTPVPDIFSSINKLVEVAECINKSPDLSEKALTSTVWLDEASEIKRLIESGNEYQRTRLDLEKDIISEEIETPVTELEEALATLPRDFQVSGFTAAYSLAKPLAKLRLDAARLHEKVGTQEGYYTVQEIERLIALGERIAAAPNASPDAFIASVWDHGVERAAELVQSIASFKSISGSIDSKINQVAWDTDVLEARNLLASHTGVFRYLSGNWRKAKALVGSLLSDRSMSVDQQLVLLDELIKAQAERKKIQEGNDFGQSAFGSDWRGEKSDSSSLMALVEWMRTLRGVGTEARLLASRLIDREGVKLRAQQLNQLLLQVRVQLDALWNAFGFSPEEHFSNQVSITRVSLIFIEEKIQQLINIDEQCARVMVVPPAQINERIQLIMRMIDLQKLIAEIRARDQLAKNAFDERWKVLLSDWDYLEQAYAWLEENSALRFVAAKQVNRQETAQHARETYLFSQQIMTELEKIAEELRGTIENLFGSASEKLKISTAREKLKAWITNSEQLSKWVAYQHRITQARKYGLSEVVEKLASGGLALDSAISAVERTYFESLLKIMAHEEPDLVRFDGELHSRQVRGFAELDLKRIKAASLEVVRAHHRQIPARNGGVGPVGVLRSEMVKKRGHLPIRQLMLKAGVAIQALKPVMMMSPLSVAQFLIPGKQKFDLLVMDEASQIQPVDAIGAIARCNQVVVVGDERQLPPTRFFAKMTESADNDDDEVSQVSDIESVLGLFVARGLSQRMLRWHYRSRHQSLIAVSNSQFYENKLFIVPSPYTQEAGMGLQFHYIPDGVFESGGKGTNTVEAKAIAKAIMEHARKYPEQSLGVATFSVSQRKAIQDELELLRRLNPDLEEFFSAHPSEPFFVKNLENVQGDERDVIMISVGYARNAQGYIAMRFGPLGAEGGERRLNVLISRAKRRCDVYASITDEDIDLERAKGKGVFAFKLFLQYARTGRISMAQRTEREMDSVFEEQIADALQKAGYQVHPQVGIAGFFIDLAIADPDMPGRYLIGIECDGRAYHSSRSARERDRLRQAVLEDHGWIIHRIWSTDWFHRPEEQLERTLQAIASAKKELSERTEQLRQRARAVPVEIVTVDRGPVVEIGLVDSDNSNESENIYVEATPSVNMGYELHETPLGILSEMVEQVVEVESPVHVSEVITRLRTAWGLQRAGARIEAIVNRAINLVCNKGDILQDGQFLIHQKSKIILRNRQNVQSSGLRKSEMLPPQEIAVGIIDVVKNNFGATEEEIVMSISRCLGFKATSGALRKVITDVIEQLLFKGILLKEDTLIVENKETITE
ncbi:AAA domain-containing protein [Samsonia erythrinae]|uniref:AAA domain-containing protein n=2 Tax=Samsonia erythrinae TaxID=160434 RepID=A0A4R3VUS2_9GAMM|nr:AAA domain-containing protein [Samsonia erythrinae]